MKKMFVAALVLLLVLSMNLYISAADYGTEPPDVPFSEDEIVELYGPEIAEGIKEGKYYFVGEDLYDLDGNLVPLGGRTIEEVPPTGDANYVPVFCIAGVVLTLGLAVSLDARKKALR